MNLATLPKTTQKSHKRIGRGHGSGRGGHTSTRGTKGQRSRGSVGLFFEGTKFKKSLLKRLPLLRGKGKLKPQAGRPVVVNLKYLNLFKKDEEVNLETLKARGILAKELLAETPVKILGDGEIKVSLTVNLPVSQGAREKIEKAGGKVTFGKAEAPAVVEKPAVKVSPARKKAPKVKEK